MGSGCGKARTVQENKVVLVAEESEGVKAPEKTETSVNAHHRHSKGRRGSNDFGNPTFKAQLHTIIRKNDPYLMQRILRTQGIALNEEIGKPGGKQTALHLAAMYNCDNSMQAILEFIKSTQPDQLAFYLGLPDSTGSNCAMVCAYCDAPDTLNILLDYIDHIRLDQKNNKGKDILKIAKKSSMACLSLINYRLKRNEPAEERLLQNQKAKEAELQKLEEEAKMNEMFSIQKRKELGQEDLDPKKLAEVEKAKIEFQQKQEKIKREQAKAQRSPLDIINAQKARQAGPTASLQLRYSAILTQFQGKNPLKEFFQDTEFPAVVGSICQDQNHPFYAKYFINADWQRPHEILQKKDYSAIHLFDDINPNDVSQGILGVCYFLSSMSAIAEYPSRLMKIFNTKESNPYGVYSVTLYSQGVPTEIIVDDHFPCYKNGGGPLFSKPKGEELWALILEKAWAKLFGNYCVTEAGVMSDALDALLGAPTEQVIIDKDLTEEKVWNDFSSWDQEHYLMCCATKSDVDKDTGLVSGHAYTVIAAYQLGQYRVLKIRNPWGKFEWKGDFSDGSPLWTDEYKKTVGYSNADDGVFCMTVTDFMKHMDYYTVSYYKDNYFRCHLEIESHRRHAEYFEFEVSESGMMNIEIVQKDKRHFGDNSGYDYSPVEIMLLKKEGNEFKVISTNQGYWGRRSYCLRDKTSDYLLLEPGSYALRVKVYWKNQDSGKFTLACNSERKLTIQRANKANYKQFLKFYMLPTARQDNEMNDIGNNCVLASGWMSPYMYCYVHNKGKGTLKLSVELTKNTNIRIPKKFSQDGKTFTMVVPAGNEELVFLKKDQRTGGGSIGWAFSSQYDR